MYASFNGFTDVVRELIAADGSVEHIRMQENDGWTALMSACSDGKKDVVRELIAAINATGGWWVVNIKVRSPHCK